MMASRMAPAIKKENYESLNHQSMACGIVPRAVELLADVSLPPEAVADVWAYWKSLKTKNTSP